MTGSPAIDALAALRARVDGAGGLAEREVLALQREVIGVRREVDVLLGRLAAHVDRLSGPGPDGMARRRGFKSVDQMNAGAIGGTLAEAERLRKLGQIVSEGRDDAPVAGGAPSSPPPVLPYLATVAGEGRLSADAAVLLREALMRHPEACERARLHVDPAVRETPLGRVSLAEVERAAVDKAEGQPLRTVRSLVARLEADLTPRQTAEDRYDDLVDRRAAWSTQERDGMVKIVAMLDPMSAAPLLAAMDGYVNKAMRNSRDDAPETRLTGQQLRADSLSWLGRHATGCHATHDGVKTTISIRMTVDQLTSGDGHGEVDFIDAPVPVGVLRRHAADAEIIPTVLGAQSEVLDHGRAERLFTRAQRRAVAERDRGCAFCGAPPSHCDVHHLRYWEHGGLTDLDNALMLCVSCHHWLHRHRWVVRAGPRGPEFVPPPETDPERRPVPGYRERVTLSPEELKSAGRDGPP